MLFVDIPLFAGCAFMEHILLCCTFSRNLTLSVVFVIFLTVQARDIHEQIVSLRASLTDDARIIDSFRLSMLHLSWRGQHLEALALLPALQAALANRKNPDRTLLVSMYLGKRRIHVALG